ncbi:MAG TPA: helix-turn-helix transcriptional regulator [Longimicrobiales bacterium]|nr:helix-turn-helix transcriptional regulator [Longimicrobiales bacterium]
MKSSRYHILLALTGGAIHGAEIRRRVEEESGGEVILYPAMLYSALDELAQADWIAEVETPGASAEQVRWRFYALTAEGRGALLAETKRLEQVVGRARAALGSVQRA